MSERNAPAPASNFLRAVIEKDLANGTYASRHWARSPGDATHHAAGAPDPAKIRTRFPPEPNGYLHVGHAKSICLNFGLARDYGGVCHMRFDDTNPEKENVEYVESIKDAVQWLGFGWDAFGASHLYFASDYFDFMYRAAEHLITAGHAYVDQQTPDEMRANRGTLTEPGTDSPWRNRPADESLALFREMRDGKHAEGTLVLRARIDMASPNINMRDPAIYRIKHAHHHNTGDTWCIYPMYTYAHPLEDLYERVTHSICTLEFEDQRPFYDWVLAKVWPYFNDEWISSIRKELADICQELHSRIPQHARTHSAGGNEKSGQLLDSLGFSHNNPRPHFDFYPGIFQRSHEANSWAELGDAALKVSADRLYDVFLEISERLAQGLGKAVLPTEADIDLRRLAEYRLPRQYEFARLNLTYVITSKRKLMQLVTEKHVSGWDDPRMPTIVGLRRRGYTAEALQLFAERIGVSKADSWIDYSTLEGALRDDLDGRAARAMAVLDPLRLKLTNWDEVFGDKAAEPCAAPVHPHHPERGSRSFNLTPEVWIEREDFMEQPPKGYHRLFPGNRTRLKYGYVIECTGCEKDADGRITTVLATLVPDTKSGTPGADSVKVKGVITWVSATEGQPAEIRLYDRLFTEAHPDAGGRDFLTVMNPDSVRAVQGWVEPALAGCAPDDKFQFERHGYFVADRVDSTPGKPVFNRAVTLKDTWQK